MKPLTSEQLTKIADVTTQLADVVLPILINLSVGTAYHAMIWLNVSLLEEFAELTDCPMDEVFSTFIIDMAKHVEMHKRMKAKEKRLQETKEQNGTAENE